MDAREFGVFIQSRRKELGMNQSQLAEKLHVTAKAVSRWERGVGFPSIELLQPLADALEITIAELMQSKRMEKEISKEAAEKIVSDTVDTIRRQEALNWKRKLILYGGYGVLLWAYVVLQNVSRTIRFEDWWTGLSVAVIGTGIWYVGGRALHCLVTGEPYYGKPEPKWRTKGARIARAVFFLSVLVLVLAMLFLEQKNVWRGVVAAISLTAIVGSGMHINQTEQENSES